MQIEAYKKVFVDAVANAEKLDEAMSHYLGQNAQAYVDEGHYGGEHVLQCRCKASVNLKKKNDKNEYILSCRGYPNCKVSVWFPTAVIHAQATDETCEKCKKVKKINFKFDKKQVPFTLPANYTACILCDVQLKEVLGYDTSQIQSLNSTSQINTNTSANSSGYSSNISANRTNSSMNISSSSSSMNRSSNRDMSSGRLNQNGSNTSSNANSSRSYNTSASNNYK